MIENECEIIKDLLPNYIEEAFSKPTNEFIETHIHQCENCKKMLEYLKNEKKEEKKQKLQDENLQIDYLKKYHTRMTILKWLVALFIIILSVIWAYILGGYMRNEKFQKDYKLGEYNHQIVETAYKKVEEFKNKNNFSLIIKKTDGKIDNQSSYYYKNGLCRWEIEDSGITQYGVNVKNEGYRMVLVDSNTDEIIEVEEFEQGNVKDYLRGFLLDNTLNRFHQLNIGESLSLEVQEEIYEGDECYVVRQQIEDEYDDEIWIEKESMLPVREIQKRYDHYEEYSYAYAVDNVTDEDVKLKEKTL